MMPQEDSLLPRNVANVQRTDMARISSGTVRVCGSSEDDAHRVHRKTRSIKASNKCSLAAAQRPIQFFQGAVQYPLIARPTPPRA